MVVAIVIVVVVVVVLYPVLTNINIRCHEFVPKDEHRRNINATHLRYRVVSESVPVVDILIFEVVAMVSPTFVATTSSAEVFVGCVSDGERIGMIHHYIV